MNREEIANFEKVHAQLLGFYEETEALVKKNPNDVMNKFKLQLINKLLASANEIFGDTKPFDDFDSFDIDGEMPTNSDVAMILGQYIKCMELVKKNNVHFEVKRWYWDVDGSKEDSSIRTSEPEIFKK